MSYDLNSTGVLSRGSAGDQRVVRLKPAITGKENRWKTQLGGGPINYREALPEIRGLKSFITLPLRAGTELTGQPVLQLRIKCAQKDPTIIAYLLAVEPDGKAVYLTEGHLRLLQGRLDTTQQTLHSYRREGPASFPHTEVCIERSGISRIQRDTESVFPHTVRLPLEVFMRMREPRTRSRN